MTITMQGRLADGPRDGLAGVSRPAWWFDPRKACHPDHGSAHLFTSDDKTELRAAAALCVSDCPFRKACDTWADEHGEKHNVYGGRVRSFPRTTLRVDADIEQYGEQICSMSGRGFSVMGIARALHLSHRRVELVLRQYELAEEIA